LSKMLSHSIKGHGVQEAVIGHKRNNPFFANSICEVGPKNWTTS